MHAQQRSSQLAAPVQSVSLAQLSAVTPQATPPTTTQIYQGLNTDMRTVIVGYDQFKGTHLEALTPQDARQQFTVQEAAKLVARGTNSESSALQQPTPVGKVVDGITFTTDLGIQVPLRLYYPTGNGPFPAVLYFHGGGFVVGTIDTYDESARAICNNANAIVVSVDYRKAPEAPFPQSYKDAIHAYNWVLSNIATYNGIATKVAVAGEGAGGNLATEVALYAKQQNIQRPTHEILIYPLITTNFNQDSDQTYSDSSLPLYTAELPYFANQEYATASDRNDPRANPLLANLSGLPATTIIAAQYDPLVSDGMAYYTALVNANSRQAVKYVAYTGVTHDFFGMGQVVQTALTAEQFVGQRLADSFK